MTDSPNHYQNQGRYSGVAVGLHWLIAALIIGMLAVGKWMTGLEAEDPLRFTLTQWHKSFGIAILILSLFRLYWRRTHNPPPPVAGPKWEKLAASATHIAFYVLLLAIPLSGWLLVSASPLNIPTVLFQTLPWPHIPLISWFGQSAEQLTEFFHLIHEMLSNLLLLLLALHVGAALRHHFYLKDGVLTRMSLFTASGKLAAGLVPTLFVITSIAAGIYAINKVTVSSIPTAIATGEVRFTATLVGANLVGTFSDSEVEIKYDPDQPESSLLNAIVLTSTMQAGDPQIAGTLSEKDWFDTENYPQATFNSQTFRESAEGEIFVAGTLSIKENSALIEFPITIENTEGKKLLKGEFTINRLDYKVGAEDQPSEDYAGFDVKIEFSFDLD